MKTLPIISLLSLLACLGGALIAGIVPEGEPIPLAGEAGAPHRALTGAEADRFRRGRELFDTDFGAARGLGPNFNCDSCRACHLDPVIGGAGGIDVQVQRPLVADVDGRMVPPAETGDLAHTHCLPGKRREEIPAGALVEERNSPTILGLGLIEAISDEAILANEDPDDRDGDGIRGLAHRLSDGRIGKLGWKSQVPDLSEFLRDAMGNEMGITVPATGSAFGFESDADGVADPELAPDEFDDMLFFMRLLDFAAKRASDARTIEGEAVFHRVGCAKCHVASIEGVDAYSNLLLHDVQPQGFVGVSQGAAVSGLYRTAPLRGLRDTAPYFHDGRSETVDDAVRRHDGEARAIREAYESLSEAERDALLAFLDSL